MRTPSLAVAVAVAVCLACAHTPSRKEREAAEIHYNLGLEALRAKRVQEALREFEVALASDDQFAEAYLGRALVYEFGYAKMAEAESDYRKAIALKPDFSEAHNDLGQLLARKGLLEEAVKEFDLALGNMLYRDPAVARCNKGQALYRLGRREEGLSEIGLCLSLAPHYCAGHRELGLIRLQEGRMREALESLGKYAEDCPTEADAWLQVGLANTKAGDPKKARDAFERCVALTGSDATRDECQRRLEVLR
jgi:type IV pilus assembly protein PilF